MGVHPWPYSLAAWNQRMPIVVHGTVSAGPYCNIGGAGILPQHDMLWDNMQADGDDFRFWFVRDDNNQTLVDFSNDAPSTSARTIANFLLEVTSASSADVDYIYWWYWGNSAAANAEGTVTNTNLAQHDAGYGDPDPARTVLCVPEAPGATTPAQRISKKIDEEMTLWWDVTPALLDGEPIGGRPSSMYQVTQILWNATTGTGLYSASGATREATYTAQNGTRVREKDGRFYIGIQLTAGVGSSGTNYVAKLRLVLTEVSGQDSLTAEFRCLVQVLNPV